MEPDIPDFDALMANTPKPVAPPSPVMPTESGTIPDFDALTAESQNLDSAMPTEDTIPDFDALIAGKPDAPTNSGTLTTEDVINDPERLGKIRKMMSKTKDVAYDTKPAEEVLEDFMTHMRFLNTNEFSVAKEAFNVYAADDETKALYGDAYNVYEDMGSMFSNGDFWGGTVDYAHAFVTSPSLYLGFGVGRVAGQAGAKAAAKTLTTQMIKQTAKQVAKKSGGKITEQVAKNQLTTQAAKVTARTAILGTLGVEAPMAAASDFVYQDIMMETGVQEEYSILQTAISTVAGGFGAILPAASLIRSSKSTLANTGDLVKQSYALRARKAAKTALPEMQKSFKAANADWLKLAQNGMAFKDNYALQEAVTGWFFDPKRDDSFIRILQRAGADLGDTSEEGFSRSIASYAESLPADVVDDYNAVFAPMGVKFGEAVTIMANSTRTAGQRQNLASQSSKFWNEFSGVSVARQNANKAVTDHLDELAKEAEAADPARVASYALSTWKKSLVSTFGTTAVNVKGWALARGANAAADMFVAGGLLGRAGIRALVDPAGAIQDYVKMKHILKNQVFTFNTLLDPFVTAEGFMKLLEKAPKKTQKNMIGQIFGGVDDFNPESFGLNPNNKVVKGVEAYTDAAQKISFVRLQDMLTKGISGLSALDKESRSVFGKGVNQLIKDGETWKITDEMWAKVTRQVLEETFSEDFTKGRGVLALTAKTIEGISNNPVLGFVVPFGRFMNSTMAFMYRFSPLGLATPAIKFFSGKGTENSGQAIAKAAAGSMALYYMAKNEGEKQEEGLQWFERRLSDGSIENISTLFPYSVYALIGRVGFGVAQGEGVNKELLDEIKKNLGPLDALENLVAPPVLKDIISFLSDPGASEEDVTAFFNIPKFVGETTGNILAGYTRPLEIYNRMISVVTPEAGGGLTPDRKQTEGAGDAFVMGLTRNISSFANFVFGEETEYGPRLYGKPKESISSEGPVKVPNPMGTIAGITYQPAARNINKLLGLIDKPPYKADSFTSGVPEYDAYINKHVTPFLEKEAERLLNNKVFMGLPKSRQIEEVQKLIKQTTDELIARVEGGYLGDTNDRLINERRKLLTRDRQARIRAKAALGITTKDHSLTMYQIEAIRRFIDLEKDSSERIQQ